MTTRNLNQTWRDVVFNQYAADHAVDAPFPVRYLIHASQWQWDIIIEIPTKIDVAVLRRAVIDFCVAKRSEADPVYEDGRIKVRPRVSPRLPPSEVIRQGNDSQEDEAATTQDAPDIAWC
ncbi:hypothetical protein C8A01DRAFT_17173 [Parachaetomium inaequale]|uniref:Uncharacterized protein n=1 Tax=Parachaetomium inaequale TaxID=2588326 RepID=A0AAN6PDA3_9PEZI|nr:hypothetical protein C8A01DRAFT_17173 [Parachaetomium inaequale]